MQYADDITTPSQTADGLQRTADLCNAAYECFGLQKQIIEALEKVCGTRALKTTTVYKWIQRFKEGRDDFEDDSRLEPQKKDKNIEAARNLIEEDRRITVNQIATSLDISYGSANSILHDNLGLCKLSAQWIPKALRPDQQNLRSDLSLTLLNKIEADEEQFLVKIITGDETWIYQYNPE
ncbi:protein GVQW3-like [Octopus sinensis]|uniref:Protein GVQW3-like n=1 Tax=Octopus sinensis TaxID=2607531 RepID=A0A6P7SYG6_9MOLL|nr:protein GVQW3-like [Octopus sinensis]